MTGWFSDFVFYIHWDRANIFGCRRCAKSHEDLRRRIHHDLRKLSLFYNLNLCNWRLLGYFLVSIHCDFLNSTCMRSWLHDEEALKYIGINVWISCTCIHIFNFANQSKKSIIPKAILTCKLIEVYWSVQRKSNPSYTCNMEGHEVFRIFKVAHSSNARNKENWVTISFFR